MAKASTGTSSISRCCRPIAVAAGTKILDALEASARQQGLGALTLSVLADNSAALRFYLRRGFAETGQAGAAHIAMKKDLA
ncbi:GNAT family N-acetyltransferase [Bradyrhizobium sp. S3.9.1]|uniref:GNAT family N-acetyltransferase n=1 Tax=Bradyrhizobium sp. S3.9.1 TaxID=3156431 RepID=UPI003391C0E8